MKKKRLIIILSAVPFLLLLPLVAMQYSSEVNWTTMDFLVMGLLLVGVGLILEFGLRKISKRGKRIAFIFIVIGIFMLIWAELAVGIFGNALAGI